MAASKDEVKDTGVPTKDAYTGMLVISLLALIGGSVLLYLDWNQYPPAPSPKGLPAFQKAAPAPPVPVAPAPAMPGPNDKKGPDAAPPDKKGPEVAPPDKGMPPPMPDAKKGM